MIAESDFHRFHQSRVSPVCWPWLTELGELGAVDELAIWVDWIRDRYGLPTHELPACWDSHGALVEELSALRTAWLAAFACDAAPDQPLRWHESFDLAWQRLRSWMEGSSCISHRHRPHPSRGASGSPSQRRTCDPNR